MIVIAVLVFLLFLGMNGYEFLCPHRWLVECVAKDSSGKAALATIITLPTEDAANKFATGGATNGRTCTVAPVRECPWGIRTSSRTGN